MADLAAIEARLTGPGGPFEIAVEDVLGARMPVFKNRLRSLRSLLELSSAQGEKEYLVHRDRRISYDEHLRLVAKLACALRDRHGVAGAAVMVVPGRRENRALALLMRRSGPGHGEP